MRLADKFFNLKTKKFLIFLFIVSVFQVSVPAGFVYSDETGETHASPGETDHKRDFYDSELIHGSTAKIEYNDNVNLAGGTEEEIEEDILLHYIPNFTLLRRHRDHVFSFDLGGDFRKGLQTETADANISAAGALNFDFPGGLRVKMKDTYSYHRFDHEFDEEPGRAVQQSNHAEILSSYAFVERLKIEGGYEYEWEKSDAFRENTTTVHGKLDVPVTWSAVSYIFGKRSTRSTDEMYRGYVEDEYMLGARWSGPYRFSAFFEIGRGKIDFDDPASGDIESTIFKTGIRVKITESLKSEASFGKDVYGNTVYSGTLNYKYSDDYSTFVMFEKETGTRTSFGGYLESMQAVLRQTGRLMDRIDVLLEGRYYRYESPDGSAGYREGETLMGKAGVEYVTSRDCKIGVYCQHARLDTDSGAYEYENNILGLMFSFGY